MFSTPWIYLANAKQTKVVCCFIFFSWVKFKLLGTRRDGRPAIGSAQELVSIGARLTRHSNMIVVDVNQLFARMDIDSSRLCVLSRGLETLRSLKCQWLSGRWEGVGRKLRKLGPQTVPVSICVCATQIDTTTSQMRWEKKRLLSQNKSTQEQMQR